MAQGLTIEFLVDLVPIAKVVARQADASAISRCVYFRKPFGSAM